MLTILFSFWLCFPCRCNLFFWVCRANSTLATVLEWQQRTVNDMIYIKIKMTFECRGYETEVKFPSENLELRARLSSNFSSLSRSLLAFSCLYFILWVSGCTKENESPKSVHVFHLRSHEMVVVLAKVVSAGFGSAEALPSAFSAWSPPVRGLLRK